jgi:hypothetical protein
MMRAADYDSVVYIVYYCFVRMIYLVFGENNMEFIF